MKFPDSFNGSGAMPQRGATPIIGQKEVPCVTFQIQVTPELMEAMSEYAQMTGLDGMSLMNHVFTRGLVATRGDFLNAKDEAAAPEAGPDQE